MVKAEIRAIMDELQGSVQESPSAVPEHILSRLSSGSLQLVHDGADLGLYRYTRPGAPSQLFLRLSFSSGMRASMPEMLVSDRPSKNFPRAQKGLIEGRHGLL